MSIFKDIDSMLLSPRHLFKQFVCASSFWILKLLLVDAFLACPQTLNDSSRVALLLVLMPNAIRVSYEASISNSV